MNALDELRIEHERMRQGLDILEAITDNPARYKQEDAVELVRFFGEYVNASHFAKEEEALFPEMEAEGIPLWEGSVESMILQHREIREILHGLEGDISAGDEDREAAQEAFFVHARRLIDLLRPHIEAENISLYPLAEEVFGPGEDEYLSDEFRRIQDERISRRRHDELNDIIQRLARHHLMREEAVKPY
jgi:hemerythrin-like domain-containing protein